MFFLCFVIINFIVTPFNSSALYFCHLLTSVELADLFLQPAIGPQLPTLGPAHDQASPVPAVAACLRYENFERKRYRSHFHLRTISAKKQSRLLAEQCEAEENRQTKPSTDLLQGKVYFFIIA